MRRFRRYPPWSVWVCAFVCAAIVGRFWLTRTNGAIPHAAEGSSLRGSIVAGKCEVIQIERPDLIIVRQTVPVIGAEEPQLLVATVQLLGVKSTESSDEAAEFTRQFLANGTPSLELDRRRLDNGGHFLAHVYVDGRLLNEELIRAGFAEADLYPGDNQTMHRSFVRAEREAKKAQRGMWAKATAHVPPLGGS